jgi:TetR/AcrR family fatty acid metabolism transcriptional regulator
MQAKTHPPYLPGPERRRQILSAAKSVFARRGYHDTNISHICDELHIARGTLYQYFESKREVFAGVVEELLERVREAVAREPVIELPEGFRATRDQVIAYSEQSIERILAAVFEDEESLRIVMREAVGLDGGIDAILRGIDEILVDRFASDLEIARKAGILRADVDARAAALFTLGGIQKLALDAFSRGSFDTRVVAAQVTRMQMVGLLSTEVT